MAMRTNPNPAKTARPARSATTAKGRTSKKPARVWDYIRKSGLQDTAKRN
jgi:hypothetical protein